MEVFTGTIIEEDELFSNLDDYVSLKLDAILVLGGGVPSSPKDPPTYVKRRCDVVAALMNAFQERNNWSIPSVLCLSAGTAHLPQYITPHNGLPLWESTASAAYLMQHPTYPVPEKYMFVETTSFDTISNAFFTRSSFTDINGWRRLLVVSNEFHIHRTKAIFDWIFSVPATKGGPSTNYELFYLSCNNVGLSNEAVEARRSHEKRGEMNVVGNLARQYTNLNSVLEFMTTKHDFYAANKLVRQSLGDGNGEKRSGNLLKLSYGQKSSRDVSSQSSLRQFLDGKIVVSLYSLVLVVFIVMGLYFSRRRYEQHNKYS
ncbi:hypothetical protein ACHAXM_002520 [Skeletonema potamos]|jgi:hypothetical protein